MDKVICIDVMNSDQRIDYMMHHTSYPLLTKGMVYDIVDGSYSMKNARVFMDDQGYYYIFAYFSQFFMTMDDFRQSKLDTILCNS